MINHRISNSNKFGGTMFDLFNLINPNCYQALAIKYIIEGDKQSACECCDELDKAIEYFKWSSNSNQSNYVDQLICQSELEGWQKTSILYIIANDTKNCKKTLELEENNRSNKLSHDDIVDQIKWMFGNNFI